MKKYICHPEFISRDVELEDGSNTNKLYELEDALHKAIRAVVEWRTDHFGEREWEEAVPQTLKAVLDSWDRNASEVAAKAFLGRENNETHEKVVE